MSKAIVVGLSVLTLVFAGSRSAAAQIKPVGTFDVLSTCTAQQKPAWVTSGVVVDGWPNSKFSEAAACSAQTGTMKWVVFFGSAPPTEPVENYAFGVKNRLESTGLLPHVIAVMFGEEWYLHFKQGDLAAWGLPKPEEPNKNAKIEAGIPIVRDWVGRQ